jgi:tRNA threonylcarbamoyl adenosine modification protein (Sua5/YciO/YrdC/YwlC family)
LAKYVQIHPLNPELRKIEEIVKILRNDGIIIYPTDTVYAIGCDIYNNKAMEKLSRIKGVKPEKANFSFICYDLSHISDFTMPFSTSIYKMMRRNLPGAFTFILNANNSIPKLFKNNKRTVGIRVPDNNIIRELVKQLGNPIATTSLHVHEEIEYPNHPELIFEAYSHLVDAVIDGGMGGVEPSTVIDCTNDDITIVRQGAAQLI